MIKIAVALIFVSLCVFAIRSAIADATRPSRQSPTPPIRTIPLETHDHQWDDLRQLPVIINAIDGDVVVWTYTGKVEVRTGRWVMSPVLLRLIREKKRKIEVGELYIGNYCGVCGVVIAFYPWKKNGE